MINQVESGNGYRKRGKEIPRMNERFPDFMKVGLLINHIWDLIAHFESIKNHYDDAYG